MSYTHLDPGRELEVCGHVYFCSDKTDLSELVLLSSEELKAREAASVEQEKAIFDRMVEIEKEWVQQASQTTAMRKAQQYQKIRPTPHTANKWVVGEYGWHERSNMVYKFTWHIYENSSWSRVQQKSVINSYELSWYLTYNTTPNPDYSGPGRQIAGQERKRFADKANLEKYLQGRIKAYEHLFTEISPPIPAEENRRFCVNGVLLPGYTVEVTMEQRVSELMALADEEDFAALLQNIQPGELSPEDTKEKPPRRATPAKAHKKKHALTR